VDRVVEEARDLTQRVGLSDRQVGDVRVVGVPALEEAVGTEVGDEVDAVGGINGTLRTETLDIRGIDPAFGDVCGMAEGVALQPLVPSGAIGHDARDQVGQTARSAPRDGRFVVMPIPENPALALAIGAGGLLPGRGRAHRLRVLDQ